MASETVEVPSESNVDDYREKLGKIMAEADHDMAFRNPKLIGTLMGPTRYIPEIWHQYRMMNSEEYEYYLKKVKESDGFDVTGCNGKRLVSGIAEARYEQYDKGIKAAKFAVREHNKTHGTKLKYLEPVRVNYQGVGGMMYYVTFKVVDKQDENRIKVYRAKVFKGAYEPSMCLEFMVLAPEGEQPPQELEEEEEEEEETPSEKRPKRPFNIFVAEFRKAPEFKNTPYKEALRAAGIKWRAMSAQEKAYYKE